MGLDPERCMCGTHVHTCTKIIAIFNLAIALLGLLGALAQFGLISRSSATPIILGFCIQLLVVGFHSLLLYGNVKRRHGFYIPYLILQLFYCSICVAVSVLYLCFTVFVTILLVTGKSQRATAPGYVQNFPGGTTAPLYLAFLTLLIMLITWLYCYFLSIVYRDYKLVKEGQLYDEPAERNMYKA